MKPKANSLYNEDALALAEKMDSELFDIIYIDPPWGKNKDDRPADEFDYEEFLYLFLQQAKRLLKPYGHLFFHADPMAKINFQVLIEGVFERDTFRSRFILPFKPEFNMHQVGKDHSNLFLYSKQPYTPLEKITRELTAEEAEKKYPFSDDRGRYRIKILCGPFSSILQTRLDFEWRGYKPPKNWYWIVNKIRLTMLYKQGLIHYGEKSNQPWQKVYQTRDALPALGTIWDDIPQVDHRVNFKWPKTQHQELFDRIIQLGSMKKGWIFDPFCGMGASLVSAARLERHWVGNDFSKEAMAHSRAALKEKKVPYTKASVSGSTTTIWNSYNTLKEKPELALMREISQGENLRLEFKESARWNRFNKEADGNIIRKILQELVAFMNSEYAGKIIIGVADDGTITGLEEDFKAANPRKNNEDGYNLFLSASIQDKLGSQAIGLYDISFMDLEGKTVCIIEVKPAEKPIFLGQDFYIRSGTEARKQAVKDAFTYIQDRFTNQYR
ncbi:MAG: hypothetical protein HEP71_03240 [Roseivirga sp.]|nr:hypothetical protein [Roseivirga sp.]